MEVADLGKTFFGEAVALADCLSRQLAQVLVDDVADMLEIGGRGDRLEQARRDGERLVATQTRRPAMKRKTG
ncbi:hypothetical protein ACFPOB_09805 [Bosea eneae]|uniref:Uncharacterized protein n=1 Tax=Bosea eneae TaxID=151454 RepID=A0ABW0IQ91_9HYPH